MSIFFHSISPRQKSSFPSLELTVFFYVLFRDHAIMNNVSTEFQVHRIHTEFFIFDIATFLFSGRASLFLCLFYYILVTFVKTLCNIILILKVVNMGEIL